MDKNHRKKITTYIDLL